MDRTRSLLDEADLQSIGRPRAPRPRRARPGAKWPILALLLAGVGVVTLWNLGYFSGRGPKAPPPSPQTQAEFERQKADSEAKFKKGEIGLEGA